MNKQAPLRLHIDMYLHMYAYKQYVAYTQACTMHVGEEFTTLFKAGI